MKREKEIEEKESNTRSIITCIVALLLIGFSIVCIICGFKLIEESIAANQAKQSQIPYHIQNELKSVYTNQETWITAKDDKKTVIFAQSILKTDITTGTYYLVGETCYSTEVIDMVKDLETDIDYDKIFSNHELLNGVHAAFCVKVTHDFEEIADLKPDLRFSDNLERVYIYAKIYTEKEAKELGII